MKKNQLETCRGILFPAVLALLSSCTSAPLYNATGVVISPRPTATEKEIGDAIGSASERLGWNVKKIGPGKIKAIKEIRSHSLTVAIHFNNSSFDLIYLDSINLKYDGNNIHKKYNVWVRELEKKIQHEIKFRLPKLR